MFEHWEIGAAALLGAACFVLGLVFRIGRFRPGVQRTYLRGDVGPFTRNVIFAFLPLGLAFVCLTAGAGLMLRHGTLDIGSDPDPLVGALMLVGLAALVIGLWWMFRPPAWAKPAWVREYDRARAAGEPLPDFTPPPLSPRAYALNWVGLAALAIVWLALSLPPGALIVGLAAGASVLLANRPRPSS